MHVNFLWFKWRDWHAVANWWKWWNRDETSSMEKFNEDGISILRAQKMHTTTLTYFSCSLDEFPAHFRPTTNGRARIFFTVSLSEDFFTVFFMSLYKFLLQCTPDTTRSFLLLIMISARLRQSKPPSCYLNPIINNSMTSSGTRDNSINW